MSTLLLCSCDKDNGEENVRNNLRLLQDAKQQYALTELTFRPFRRLMYFQGYSAIRSLDKGIYSPLSGGFAATGTCKPYAVFMVLRKLRHNQIKEFCFYE